MTEVNKYFEVTICKTTVEFTKLNILANNEYEAQKQALLIKELKNNANFVASSLRYEVVNPVLSEPCPNCASSLIANPGGGIKCTKCSYWFCF